MTVIPPAPPPISRALVASIDNSPVALGPRSSRSRHTPAAEAGFHPNEEETDNDVILVSPEVIAGGDITSHILAAISGGALTFGLQALKLKIWLDQKKSRKVSIKYKDISFSVSGSVPEKELERYFAQFQKLQLQRQKLDTKAVEIGVTDPDDHATERKPKPRRKSAVSRVG
jgi:hypothetical protein